MGPIDTPRGEIMLDGPLVFVDIDTQADFLDPGGSLFIPGSGAILENLKELTDFARDRGIPVLATACAHTTDEADPEPFPPHCLAGTEGQERIPETRWDGMVLSPEDRFRAGSGMVPHLTLEKTRYDVFSRPDADEVIAAYGRDDPTFVVYGVATDYCVRAAVLGLLARGRKVAIVVDAIFAIDPEGEPALLGEFISGGAALALTDAVVSPR